MRKCLICKQAYISAQPLCSACGYIPEKKGGFFSYAPELTTDNDGFKSEYFQPLAQVEDRNFWFRARNQLIHWALKNYHPNFKSFLEIGCGNGYVLSSIANEFTLASISGSEIFIAGLSNAAIRRPTINLFQMDAREIPYIDEFDCIGAFDVLEHIREDYSVLEQVYSAMKVNGIIVITVPQHNWLWSPVDEYACHVRRYSAKDLHVKIKDAGFEILRSTSFVTSLLPAMFISRYIQKYSSKNNNPTSEFNIPTILNLILEKVLNVEIALIRMGVNYPIGGSRLVVARKS